MSRIPAWAPPSQWIMPDWPVPDGIRALSTTRHGGISSGAYAAFNLGTAVGDVPGNVAANRVRLRSCLPAEPLWLKQVHGTRVVDADHVASHQPLIEADGSVTHRPGRVLVIQAADCMPVLLAVRSGGAVAAAHAGWRGLAHGVIENAVNALGVPPAEVLAWLGPAISGNAYEVGQDVHDAFVGQDPAAASAFVTRDDKYLVDLYAIARQRLARMGVTQVHGGGYCTLDDAERFYSYRRDGITGRMATLVWMNA